MLGGRKNSIWDIQGGVANEEARESRLAWECLEAFFKNSLEWKDHSSSAKCQAPPFAGFSGTETPCRGRPAQILPNPCSCSRTHVLGAKAAEFRELCPHSHLLASGLICGPREQVQAEGQRRAPLAWGAQGSRAQWPHCSCWWWCE